MDSADASDLRDFLSNNNARMDHQEEQMLATGRAVQALVVQVSELTTQFQHLRSPTKLTSTTSSFNFNEHQTTSWAASTHTRSSFSLAALRSTHSRRRWDGSFIVQLWAVRPHTCWLIFGWRTNPFRIIPSSSRRWLLSVSGMRRRSGTCSCMGWLTGFRRKSSQWNYPLILMESSN